MKEENSEKEGFLELKIKNISVHPDEILPPDGEITAVFDSSIDAKSAQSGFRIVPDVRGNVLFNTDKTEAKWQPSCPMIPGSYTLVLEDITDEKCMKVIKKQWIPFVVSCIWRTFPKKNSNDVILGASKKSLAFSKESIYLAKVLDPRKNVIYQVAVDEKGKKINFDEALEREQKNYSEKYGKIHPKLHEEIKRRKQNIKIPVAIWLSTKNELIDKSKFELGKLKEEPGELLRYRAEISEIQSKVKKIISEKFYCKVEKTSELAPVLFVNLTASQIREIAQMKEVSVAYLYEKKGVEDLEDSMNASNADDVIDDLGYDGSGISVAVWEGGADTKTDLVIEEEYDTTPSYKSSHTRLVTAIIKNKESNAPHGYAPDCKTFAANDYDLDALEWAVNKKKCSVINQSFHRSSEPASGDLSFDDVYKDYLVLHYPYPMIVQAAGNYFVGDDDPLPGGTSNEFVNHKGYNSLTVGNHNDDLTAMSGSSVFVNPNSTHGDRELPEICANGEFVTAAGVTMSGTSFASPAVAGTAALLQEVNWILRYWPEGVRAILMAGALRNISGNSWIQDLKIGVDGLDGSGALNAAESVRITLNRKQRNDLASSRGWDIGTLTNNDFDSNKMSKFSYKIKVPAKGMLPRRVKVALAWNSKVTHFDLLFMDFYIDKLTLDYDLLVYEGNNLVASSMSWDNSYEIAEFQGKPGKTYDVKIVKYSGDDWSWYGLAWTVINPFLRVQAITTLPT